MENICVSIFMLTYNQREFIAQAIESVLMQETSFTYQLVIGEDKSTDGTREICKDYAAKYPTKIKLNLNEKNLGLGANYVKTYAECTGKYVAICDGDDYWTDPCKLQKQVDFLIKNPGYTIVYTNNFCLFPSGEKTGSKQQIQRISTSFEDIVFGNYIPSVTVLFKNSPLTNQMQRWLPSFPYCDWPTYLLVTAQGGKIGFLDFPTAVYRKNFGTSTLLRNKKSKPGEINKAILKNLLNDDSFQSRKELLRKAIVKLELGLMASYNKEKRFLRSLVLCLNIIRNKKSKLPIKIYLYSLKLSLLKYKKHNEL